MISLYNFLNKMPFSIRSAGSRSNPVFTLLLPAILFLASGYSAGIPVKGLVMDENSELPLFNVNVVVKHTGLGDATDKDGYFSINIPSSGSYILEFSHIGYKTKEVPVTIPREELLHVHLKETFFEMNDLVVTATRTPKVLQDVPVATEVISQDVIKNSGAQDVGELLALRSGVSVSSSVAGGSIVSIMGMDSKYILILVDGQPVTGKFNSRVSLDQIPTNSVKKIEIIKGPNSSLYGSEAMGGVINIITSDNPGRTVDVSLRYDGGDENFNPLDTGMGNRVLDASLSGGEKDLNYTVSTQLNHINVDQTNEYIELDEILKGSLISRVRWNMNEANKLSTSFSGFKDLETSHSSTMNTETRIIRRGVHLTHNWTPSPLWTFVQYHRYGDYSRRYRQIYPTGDLKSDDLTGENEWETEVSAIYEKENTTLNLGAEYSYAAYESDRLAGGKRSLYTGSIYGQADFLLLPRLNIVIGSRMDNNSEIAPVYSPRLAAMYSLKNRWKFRAMWGKGFRMPTFMDRYINWYHYQFNYRVVGNPDLKPETSEGYSLGFEYYHSGAYRVSFMFYRTRFLNMIDDYIMPESGYLSYRNIARVLYTGVELQGSFTISSQWVASWGFNWVNNLDLDTDELLPNTQPLSANIHLRHRLPGRHFRYMIRVKWIGPYYPMEYIPATNEYITSEKLRNSQIFLELTTVWNWKAGLALESGVKNILDVTDDKYGPFIGRLYYLKINYSLNGD